MPRGGVPFHGAHQAGIATPAQDRLHIAAFDLLDGVGRGALRDLLARWTQAAERMTAGRPIGPAAGDPLAPPVDTGEALSLPPARLTITFGFGPSLFERSDLGLAARRPAPLQRIPAFPGDALDPARSDGDLCVQACADDPQVAFHAVRNLARLGRGTVVMRWAQLGFGRTSRTSTAQDTPRNLMGFKDGTNNLTGDDAASLDEHVWVGAEGGWLAGGTYMVCRRIRMRIETWDRAVLREQQHVIGRRKLSGAPLGAHDEHDPVDLQGTNAAGALVIPSDAHIRLAAPVTNGGIRLLRRGYSFTDGIDAGTGHLDAGLFFISFQRDPARFAAVQGSLAGHDAMDEYIVHTSSAVFAVAPGIPAGASVGDTLFA